MKLRYLSPCWCWGMLRWRGVTVLLLGQAGQYARSKDLARSRYLMGYHYHSIAHIRHIKAMQNQHQTQHHLRGIPHHLHHAQHHWTGYFFIDHNLSINQKVPKVLRNERPSDSLGRSSGSGLLCGSLDQAGAGSHIKSYYQPKFSPCW